MFRRLFTLILLAAIIGFAVITFQKADLNGTWVYTDNTILAGYFNLGGAYYMILNKIKNIGPLETTMLNSALAQIGNKDGPGVEEIVKWVSDWDAKGLFRPTGGLWWALEPDLTQPWAPNGRFFLKAEIKPKELYEFLASMTAFPVKPSIIEENRVVLPPPNGKGPSIEIAPYGIFLGTPPAVTQVPTDWQGFLNIISSPFTFLAVEVNLEKPDFKRVAFGGNPNFLPINRGRIHLQMNEFKVVVSLQDTGLIPQATQMIQQGLNFGKEYLRNSASSLPNWVPTPIITQALDQIKIVNKDQWFGVALENIPPEQGQALGSGLAGLVVAVAVPNFIKSREQARTKACFANMRVILGAIEMYNMDHSEMKHDLTMADVKEGGILIKENYLKSKVTTPKAECEYYSNGDLCKDGKIFCKFHGCVDDPNTWPSFRGNVSQPQPFRFQPPPIRTPDNGQSISNVFGQISKNLENANRTVEPTQPPRQPESPSGIAPVPQEARPVAVQPISNSKGYLSGDDVNIRTTPEIRNDNRIALLDKFTRFEILERADGNPPWYKIQTSEGKIGWVRSDFAQIVASFDGIPQPSKKKLEGTFIDGESNVRSGPGTEFSLVDVPRKGVKFTLLEKQEKWLKVQYGDITGWTSIINVEIANSSMGEKNDGLYFHRVRAKEGTLPLYVSPSNQSQIIGQIPPDASRIRFLGETKNKFFKIQFQGVVGWANQHYLYPTFYRLTGSPGNTYSVRSNPGESSPEIATIKVNGEPIEYDLGKKGVQVVGQWWYPIIAGDIKGWVPLHYLQAIIQHPEIGN